MKRTPGKPHRLHGFTMIELLAVVAIMIIMSSIVIGGYFSLMSGYAFRSTMDHFKGALELTKQQASMQGTRAYLWVVSDPSRDLYTYTVVQQAGTITDTSEIASNLLVDEFADFRAFRPDLLDPDVANVGRDYTNSLAYNLSSEFRNHRRFTISEGINSLSPREGAVGWIIPLKRYNQDSSPTSMVTGDWLDGDRYGWESSPRFELPLGFVFSDDSRVTKEKFDFIYYNPDGSCGTKAGETVNAVFEIIEEYTGASCTVEVMAPSGEFTIEIKPAE